MSEQPAEVPESSAMVVSQMVITRQVGMDGTDAICINGVDHMTLLEVLGILEFAKVFVVQEFLANNEQGDG